MSEPFLAEIRMVGFNFAPRGWAFCDGQILPINQNQSLYSLLGTTYGGDGVASFALPDLRGRAPIHTGNGGGTAFIEGQKGGEETHTLTSNELPQHDHIAEFSTSQGNTPIPTDNTLAYTTNAFNEGKALTTMGNTTTNTGGGQAHNNMQPFLALNFCIALQGLFPSRD
ncbi:MAG: tail fiber protein [Marinicella sp.]